MDGVFWPIVWTACGVVIFVAGMLAGRSRRARVAGRVATGVLFIVGGALVHVINLVTGADYASFADPAHLAWVTDAWREVVAPRELLFIGLLAAFEATVGVLAISGGRRTELGYAGVLAFYLALWVFGWFTTVWCLAMIPPTVLLLRAERRAACEPSGAVEVAVPAGIAGGGA